MASSSGINLGIDIDYKSLESSLNDVGKRALGNAASKLLNNAAFEIKGALVAYTDKDIDRPTSFTRNAWLVAKAKPADGDKMSAAIYAKPIQAAYLTFIITGKTRHGGDPGAGPHDVFSFGSKLTRFGGVDQKAMARYSKIARDEKKARKELRSKRHAAAQNKTLSPQDRRALIWSVASHNRPGVFFGVHDGVKGLWQRPQRYTSSAHRKTGSPVWTKPGSQLTLLFGISKTSRSKPMFHYDQVVAAAFSKNVTPGLFAAELDKQTALLAG